MKVSYNWLKDYLECDLSVQEIAEIMTSIGIEVDSIEEQEEIPGGLAGVVVAEVVECNEHPSSDHLHVTKVNDGTKDLVTVVCGAPNVAAGQKVLFARVGAVLPEGFKIKKAKLRGVDSYGMICAEDELQIGDDDSGIKVLPADAVPGTPAKEYLGIASEAVIEYEITANRIDAASHIGVARDLYAYMQSKGIPCKYNLPSVSDFETKEEAETSSEERAIPIDVQAGDGAPIYTGLTIKDVKVGPSPEWLQKKLISIGLNPVDNIVDISNFVLFETGQPLHTFDADKIAGNKVIVRRANEGEKLITLDEVERKLSAEDLVIADENEPMCIAGVFGGLNSGVTAETKNVFLEAAYFEPGTIRKSSRRHGLQTDASYRFERGIDPNGVEYASKRAALLICELAGGHIVGQTQVFGLDSEIKNRAVIELSYDRIQKFIGKQIGVETIETILTELKYDFIEKYTDEQGNTTGAKVGVPTYMVDVTRECDVVEEILRIYGYDNIELPKRLTMSVNATEKPEPEKLRDSISNFFAANGFVEIMSNSLTKADYYKDLKSLPVEQCVQIVNPLSADLNVMRQTQIFNGLEAISYNINRQASAMRMFEYGSVYSKNPEMDGKTLKSYEEHQCFTLFMTGDTVKTWRQDSQKTDYFSLKEYVSLLLKRFGANVYDMWTEAAPEDMFAEGIVYKLPGKGGGEKLATMGTVSAKILKNFGIKQPVYVAEIHWPVLFALIKRNRVAFTEPPKFPSVRRDLALLLDESVKYSDLRESAFKAAKKLLKDVILFDVYRGKNIPEGKKQYALGFIFLNEEKTLTDKEIEKSMKKLLSTFENRHGAILR